jgi:hypothetical protein
LRLSWSMNIGGAPLPISIAYCLGQELIIVGFERPKLDTAHHRMGESVMKKVTASLVIGLVVGQLVGTVAGLSSAVGAEITKDGRFRPLYRAELNRFFPGDGLVAGRIEAGSVEIDTWSKEVTLSLNVGFYCPAGRFCPEVMPAPINVNLPIVSTTQDQCGTKIITARKDQPGQGGREELEIRDNTKNKCPHFAPLADVEVIYVTESGSSPNKIRSTFSGERFTRLTETPLDTLKGF